MVAHLQHSTTNWCLPQCGELQLANLFCVRRECPLFNRLITSLLLYPAMRKEILEVANINGEITQAEQLVADLDRALIELGELALQVEQSGLADNAEFCERMKSESLEVRQAANQFRGISEVGDKLADLFIQLAEWLDVEFRASVAAERKMPPGASSWN
jgi:hypothetical protein